ncbi:MAG: LysM peptidoglycan-binding domain-containing protein [Aulosira sp. ZfuVER01]|nr:LysM domain-containing protein [Aulosira sp. ZfuVER01]MDZ8001480.1 LysM domain-containing protein [Aulosira sp. DedVER01a]MDZ8051652.1 LysM domain-containing protein [Aulosira sp. ZfuCHP01]
MNIKLNCPVCGYQEVAGKTCPNCDTDLSVIRMLQELPSVETLVQPVKVATWPIGIALLMLMIGVCLGAGSSFIFQQTQLHTLTVSAPHPVAATSLLPKPPNTPVVVKKPPKPTTYTVQSGDYLSAIAEKFCGTGTSWDVMVKANPQLKGRENHIDVGEVFKIPNCKEQPG